MIIAELQKYVATESTANVVDVHSAIQNPGLVVTLVHKEDWDNFSASVCVSSSPAAAISQTHHQDAFPDDDVVWGKSIFVPDDADTFT